MKESNFEKTYESQDMVMFRTTCWCGSDEHILHVTVDDWNNCEKDPHPVVTFDFNCKRRDNHFSKGLEKIWERIKDACKILFTGQLVVDESFIFRDENHLRDFRSALDEAIKQVEDCFQKAGENKQN